MELKIKEKYLEYSIGGGKVKAVKLKNLNPRHYEIYFNMGYSEFFEDLTASNEVIDRLPIIEEDMFLEDIKIEDKEDDIN
jgi:hypothetical protein